MEFGHQPSTVHGTAHWGSFGVHQYQGNAITLLGEKFSEAFRVLIQWQQNSITWYMDDQPYYSINTADEWAAIPVQLRTLLHHEHRGRATGRGIPTRRRSSRRP